MGNDVEVNGMLEKVYRLLQKAGTSSRGVDPSDLPHSSVFYIRRALSDRHATNYLLEHIQIALWLEGMLPVDCVKKIPKWYIKDYMKGVKPNMKVLANQVRELYNRRIQGELSVSWKV